MSSSGRTITTTARQRGRAFVYLGAASGLNAAGVDGGERPGERLVRLFGGNGGDVNGDGYSDVIVGASLYDNGQDYEGRAFVYLGSASGLNAAGRGRRRATRNTPTSAFRWDGGGRERRRLQRRHRRGVALRQRPGQRGRAFVYLGAASGLNAAAAWTAESDQAGADFGRSVGTAGT